MTKKRNIKKFSGLLLFIIFVIVILYFFKVKTRVVNNTQANIIKVEPKIEVPELTILGRAELSYKGGTVGRGRNIELGVEKINGTTILPGEEFSFVKSLGPVSEEDGFSEEKVFLNGEVVKGLGGGLCQVSTILFQSLLDAGLPITERHNHTYSVVMYDTGLDATFSNPGPDLKFKNDTENPLVIKGKTENQKAIFEIHGVYDGRQASTTDVEVDSIVDVPPTKYVFVPVLDEEKPECINTPQIGYTAKVKYNVLYPTGKSKEQIFTSKYRPLQKVCYVLASSFSTTTAYVGDNLR